MDQLEEKKQDRRPQKKKRSMNDSQYIKRTKVEALKSKHVDDKDDCMEKVLKDQADNWAEIFALFDKNSDGEISSQELREVMLTLGHKEVIDDGDRAGSGYVSFEEFLEIVKFL